MVSFSLGEAAERTGTSKADVWRAIKEGSLAANRTSDGGFAIEENELLRVFEPKPPPSEERPAAEAPPLENLAAADAAPLKSGATSEIAVAFAALEAELKGLLAHSADPPARS